MSIYRALPLGALAALLLVGSASAQTRSSADEQARLLAESDRLIREVAAVQSEVMRLDAEARPLYAERDRLVREYGRFESGRRAAEAEHRLVSARRTQIQAEQSAFLREVDLYKAEVAAYEAEQRRLGEERGRLRGLSNTNARRRAYDDALQGLEQKRQRLFDEQAQLDATRQRLAADAATMGVTVDGFEMETTQLEADGDLLTDGRVEFIRRRDALIGEQQQLMVRLVALQLASNRLECRADRLAGKRTAPCGVTTTRPHPIRASGEAENLQPLDGRLDVFTHERNALRDESERLRQELRELETEVRQIRTSRRPVAG